MRKIQPHEGGARRFRAIRQALFQAIMRALQNLVHRASPFARSFHFFCFPRPWLQKILRIRELPHVGPAKICEPLSASSTRRRGDANARMDGGNRRCSRDWPDLVDRRDVQLGPRGRLGNEFGRNIAAC